MVYQKGERSQKKRAGSRGGKGVGGDSQQDGCCHQDEIRLFGSITSKDIAEALLKMDLNVDKKKIFVKDPIKAIGNYSVEVKLHANAAANLTVRIEEA